MTFNEKVILQTIPNWRIKNKTIENVIYNSFGVESYKCEFTLCQRVFEQGVLSHFRGDVQAELIIENETIKKVQIIEHVHSKPNWQRLKGSLVLFNGFERTYVYIEDGFYDRDYTSNNEFFIKTNQLISRNIEGMINMLLDINKLTYIETTQTGLEYKVELKRYMDGIKLLEKDGESTIVRMLLDDFINSSNQRVHKLTLDI